MAEEIELPCCDLVMKGGITSGIIYPRLVARLAERYRFKNIGGSSAGAIGAGAAAAAEYGRRHGNTRAFKDLDGLPAELGASQSDGRSRLFHLFQPAASLRDHFEVLQSALNAGNPVAAGMAFAWAMVARFLLPMGVSLLLGTVVLGVCLKGITHLGVAAALGWAVAGMVTWLLVAGVSRAASGLIRNPLVLGLLAVVLGVGISGVFYVLLMGLLAGIFATLVTFIVMAASIVIGLAWTVARFLSGFGERLSFNNFGICSGVRDAAEESPHAALTEWLHQLFNGLAGLRGAEEVLIFGHLWGCRDAVDAVPAEVALRQPGKRAINLEMMTTALCQRLPYRLPFRGVASNMLLFDKDEWRALFPAPVFAAIEQCSTPSNAQHPVAGRQLWHLPQPADFPVVVAVRMSLSFPVLLSAVPLYSVDWTRTANTPENHTATRVWFSDGGISSNLPLHFFDSKLPSHPTFAINLKAFHPDFTPKPGEAPGNETGRVYLPKKNAEGIVQHWTPTPSGGGITSVAGFLWSIVDTMQCWRDQIQFPSPGYRDRIAQISQLPDEGGLNLDMPKDNIIALGNAGENAAKELIARFAPAANGKPGAGWRNHRAIRLRTLLGQVESMMLEIDASAGGHDSWRALLRDLPAYEFKSERSAHEDLGDTLFDQVHALAGAIRAGNTAGVSLTDDAPKPVPELRITPLV